MKRISSFIKIDEVSTMIKHDTTTCIKYEDKADDEKLNGGHLSKRYGSKNDNMRDRTREIKSDAANINREHPERR